ncbi:MAG: HNH endonuclease [Acidobacteriia bacterium]|jgi:5-methylcytosine-specific restriction endonuclease McrA|nr:HNH endonuclease [Terriglobia bacterium]
MPRDPFYNTASWKRLRKTKLARDPLCEYCPTNHRQPATEVDHEVAINAGGDAYAWENLRSACHECHSRKTYYVERLGRDRVPVKGVDPKTGLPVDPMHWWNKKNLPELTPKDRARVEKHT